MTVAENKDLCGKDREQETWAVDSDRYRAEDAAPNAAKLTDLDFEYQAAAHEAGREEPVYGFFGRLWEVYHRFARKKEKVRVKKKVYLWLLLLTGWAGGHRYYERRWVVGLLYSALCWTGLPVALCVLDAMAVIPIRADGEGCIIL